MANLDDVRDDYTDENLPVFLLLGLVSSLRRLEPLLPPLPAPTESPPSAAAPSAEPVPSRFLSVVLGLVAFREHLMATLTPVRDAAKPTAARGTPGDSEAGRAPTLRELLR